MRVVRYSTHAPAALTTEIRPGIYCTGLLVGPAPHWTGMENVAFTGSRNPESAARSQSLYRAKCRDRRTVGVH
jgi:hypothetical protein